MTEGLIVAHEGVAGRITLARPEALNALSHAMCLGIEKALDAWRDDRRVAILVIDAEGDRAFCAGGDVAAMHAGGMAGDYDRPRAFWRDEYRMNAKLYEYPKPVIAFLQGFVMGGGVGVGCHASHRIVCESTQIAMPEAAIGLIPDVGGSLLLAQAPGRLGEYLAVTGARMGSADAIHAGFADRFVAGAAWPALKAELCATGNWKRIADADSPPPTGVLEPARGWIDPVFAGAGLADIAAHLAPVPGETAEAARLAMARNSPLSMAAGMALVRRLRGGNSVRRALTLEYRFTARAMGEGDFLEGVRAQIIDKDRKPRWRHQGPEGWAAAEAQAAAMLAPLAAAEGGELRLEEELA